MRNLSRAGGLGLLVYGIGSLVAFMGSGAPGGDYDDKMIADFIIPSHFVTAYAFCALGALASLGLLVFGNALRGLGENLGRLAWGATVAGVAAAIVGAFVVAGVDIAMAEGGSAIAAGVSHPVVYALSEIGNLLSVCAPALMAGVVAFIIAVRSGFPVWVRIFCVLGGICGILAPLYFTLFVFVLWTIVIGVWAAITGARVTTVVTDHPVTTLA